jgi:hypothetical protein
MEKQRKFLMVLPLLVIPFLTMAFWALGGGRDRPGPPAAHNQIDTSLPAAQFDNKARSDKMSVYHAYDHDSTQSGVSPSFLRSVGLEKGLSPDTASITSPDEQANQVQAKLEQLTRTLSKQSEPVSAPEDNPAREPQRTRQIRKMMRNMENSGGGADPEMQQLNSMLEKIQAIQNPASVKKASSKPADYKAFRAIPAVIDGKQKVADGAAVKIKLSDTATIKNQLLAKGQEIYGTCQITNQRLLLTIQNIRLDQQIIPVNLVVFSLDGMAGIPAPEAELSGAAGDGAQNIIQSMQVLSMDQSLGAQAAAGGVNAAKGLFSKKLRKIKVKLKDGLPLLLKINR